MQGLLTLEAIQALCVGVSQVASGKLFRLLLEDSLRIPGVVCAHRSMYILRKDKNDH